MRSVNRPAIKAARKPAPPSTLPSTNVRIGTERSSAGSLAWWDSGASCLVESR